MAGSFGVATFLALAPLPSPVDGRLGAIAELVTGLTWHGHLAGRWQRKTGWPKGDLAH